MEKTANHHETWNTACDVVDRLISVFKRGATDEERAQIERRIDHLDLRAIAADIVTDALQGITGKRTSSEVMQRSAARHSDLMKRLAER